jgi:Tfp pilus assembly protein FimT
MNLMCADNSKYNIPLLIALAIIGVLVALSLPEMRRYIRIERM